MTRVCMRISRRLRIVRFLRCLRGLLHAFIVLDDNRDSDLIDILLDVHALAFVFYYSTRGAARVDHNKYARFNFETLSDAECLIICRMTKSDLVRLANALGVPPQFRDSKRRSYAGVEGIALVLARLAYPGRLCDLTFKGFGKLSEPDLSRLFRITVDFIWSRFSHLLEDVSIWEDDLSFFARAIWGVIGRYQNCWGFIDGTIRAMCRPSYAQQLGYSGHKRKHGIKFQSIALPNGLIGYLWGPVLGRRHDAHMLDDSNLLNELRQMMVRIGSTYCIYGDPAYPLSPVLQCPFRGAALTVNQRLFNRDMSAARVTVEWLFGIVLRDFAFLDFKANLKLWLSPIAIYYKVAVLLTNCLTCLNGGNQVSMLFGMSPPSIEEYLMM